MLNENIKNLRKAKGLSQEELANKLNIVRQTLSKWEQGLSVPDADMLIKLSACLGVAPSLLLGDEISDPGESMADLAEKLERENASLARRNERNRRALRWVSAALCVLCVCLLFYAIVPALAGLSLRVDAASVGVIGGADGPTSIYISSLSLNWPMVIFVCLLLAASIAGLALSGKGRR